MPSQHLISALLSIDQESRQHALRFYNVKLPIYRTGQMDLEQLFCRVHLLHGLLPRHTTRHEWSALLSLQGPLFSVLTNG